VLDKTEFTAPFSFRLEFTSDLGSLNGATPETSSPSELSIFTALEEQLGMRLRSATGPVEVLVIDHVERPSPNLTARHRRAHALAPGRPQSGRIAVAARPM
jgi:uncharacterized protein (TIGR03435 family)